MQLQKRDIAKRFATSVKSYDGHSDFHQKIAEALALKAIRPLSSAKSILEIGCHTGVQTRALKKHIRPDCLYTLLDMHAGAQNKLKEHNLHFPFICADGEALPFAPASFDLIVSGSTFQWFKNWSTALQGILTTLRPGGSLIFSQFLAPSLEPLKSAFGSIGRTSSFLRLLSESELVQACKELKQAELTQANNELIESELTQANNKLSQQKFGIEVVDARKDFEDFSELTSYLRAMGVQASPNSARPLKRSELNQVRLFLDEERQGKHYHLQLCAGIVEIKKPLN
ncbi:MAG: methyltransferase domain-containing protein [Planctomycetes bacterium]|nr:methyltransferase domain-containing protein [Planctomycetota bacterium]